MRLTGKTNLDQQLALGVVGVNLLHACMTNHQDPVELVRLLSENIEESSVEVDSVQMSGPAFKHVNNRVMQIELVHCGLTRAVMFDSEGNISSPSEALFKQNIMVLRGRFRPLTHSKLVMLKDAMNHYQKTISPEKPLVPVCEIATDWLYTDGSMVEEDFLARISMLVEEGFSVMVSDHEDNFSLVEYLNRYSPNSSSLVLGSHNLHKILDPHFYGHLSGGLLAALGLMLNRKNKLYIYPILTDSGNLTLDKIKLSRENRMLLDYLIEAGLVEQLENNSDVIYVSPADVLEKIKAGEDVTALVPRTALDHLRKLK